MADIGEVEKIVEVVPVTEPVKVPEKAPVQP